MCFWCDWRSTQVVNNHPSSHQPCSFLFLGQSIKFHFLTQFSIDFSQQGLTWWIMQYYIILWRKIYDLYENSKILRKKEVLDLRFSGKYQSESAQTKIFTFFNDFQLLRPGFNTIKKLSKPLILKNNLNFLKKKWRLVLPSLWINFSSLYIIQFWSHFVWNIFIWLLVENKEKI